MVIDKMKGFLDMESASGILLLFAALLAMVVENSAAKHLYDALLGTLVEIRIGDFEIAKPLLLWINDGLMAIFFFLIGIEIKREFLSGELSDSARVGLPVVAAVGGMAIPAAIYASINWGDPVAMKGWAIPSATDIAFSLGVLALLGNRIPQSLKLFLMTLAIIDDLGAIIIIAVFYTADLSPSLLIPAAIAIGFLFILNRGGVLRLAPYMLVGLCLWAAVLKSGVHATLAGVLTAFFIPFKKEPGETRTQLERLEHDLHPSVAYGILPLFAFANAGISFEGITLDSMLHPTHGMRHFQYTELYRQPAEAEYADLVADKKARRNTQWNRMQLYGVALLCGIGFTMSLFVGSLAFEQGGPDFAVDDRLGILLGSLASGILGYSVLRFFSGNNKSVPTTG